MSQRGSPEGPCPRGQLPSSGREPSPNSSRSRSAAGTRRNTKPVDPAPAVRLFACLLPSIRLRPTDRGLGSGHGPNGDQQRDTRVEKPLLSSAEPGLARTGADIQDQWADSAYLRGRTQTMAILTVRPRVSSFVSANSTPEMTTSRHRGRQYCLYNNRGVTPAISVHRPTSHIAYPSVLCKLEIANHRLLPPEESANSPSSVNFIQIPPATHPIRKKPRGRKFLSPLLS